MSPENEIRFAGELDLDPVDWIETRALAHRMVDDMFSMLETVREGPVWQPVPESVAASFREPLPQTGQDLGDVYERFKRDILPYPTGSIHPRFWGWVMSNGTITGALSEFLAAAMNSHCAGYAQSATHVERQVIRWLVELMGYPETANGVLVSGGTVANLSGLALARQTRADFDVRNEGLRANGSRELTVYGSGETHSWIYKACELMGLGRQAFQPIEVDDSYRIHPEACRQAILKDIARGAKPFCVIGNAGTVNTGAIDDLRALREIADEFDLWFHIDGAIGSLAILSGSRDLLAGQESADSIALDLHKWGYMQLEIATLLVRDGDTDRATFEAPATNAPNYLRSTQRGIAVEATYFADRGLQLSRSFRALKAWMSLKNQGIDALGSVIDQNIQQIQYLEALIANEPHLELLAPVTLNIVCFRYVEADRDEQELNALNAEILVQLQESGIAVPSSTWLRGRFAIRVCNTNHRSRRADFDLLVASVRDIGAAVFANTTDH